MVERTSPNTNIHQFESAMLPAIGRGLLLFSLTAVRLVGDNPPECYLPPGQARRKFKIQLHQQDQGTAVITRPANNVQRPEPDPANTHVARFVRLL